MLSLICNYQPFSNVSECLVRASGSLQLGATSVLVVVPLTTELLDSKNLQFSVQYIFKPHTTMFEEKITYSPELEEWMQPYSDIFRKKNRWLIDSTGLSAAVRTHSKEITEAFNKVSCSEGFFLFTVTHT